MLKVIQVTLPFLVILICISVIFTCFIISDYVYFQLLWFLKRAVAEATKDDSYTKAIKHTILISIKIPFLLAFHENMLTLTGLILIALATVLAWMYR